MTQAQVSLTTLATGEAQGPGVLKAKDEQSRQVEIEKIVLRAQSASIKMPFIRKLVKDTDSPRALAQGETIICDIVSSSHCNMHLAKSLTYHVSTKQ